MTVYPEIKINVKLDNITKNIELNRNNLRKIAIKEFTKEKAGKGIGELSTKYKYIIDYSIYNNLPGFPMDLIFKTSKWFFIEQDIRYWNYSGRNMLMESYKEKLNKII